MRLFESEIEDIKIIFRDAGRIIIYFLPLYIISAAISLIYRSTILFATFSFIALLIILLHIFLRKTCRTDKKGKISHFFISVTVIWIILAVLGSFPFAASISLLDAFFESTATLTTTAFTMLANPVNMSRAILFFRSMQNLTGALFFIITLLTVSKIDQREEVDFVERMLGISKKVLKLYFYFIVFGIVLFYLSGLDFFSSLNYAFSSISTGGSSIHGSISVVKNTRAYLISALLSILGAMNVLLIFEAVKGNIDEILKNIEVKAFFMVIISGIVISSLASSGEVEALYNFYHFISASTTSGFMVYTPAELQAANELFKASLIIAMLIGGSVYSSAGGIKLHRVFLLIKSFGYRIEETTPDEIREERKLHNIEDFILKQEDVLRAGFLIFSYVIVFILGALFLAYHGNSIGDSILESASAISNTGLTTGIVNPNAPASIKLVIIAEMLLGRLEVIIPLISFYYLASKLKIILAGR